MGNFFTKKDDLILDFGGLRTENMSSTIPYMNKLNADAKSLVDRLNIKQNIQPTKATVFTESENYDMYKLFEKTQNLGLDNDNNFSDTSPFITSDLYKSLIKTQKGGNMKSSESDEESSSSSSSSEAKDKKKKHDKKHDKKHEKKHMKEKDSESEEDDDDFDDDIETIEVDSNENSSSNNSYESSTAHTDGIDSNMSSSVSSTVSYKKNKKRNRRLPDSINTSDINMISVEE
jgi:hypothetical protein